MQMIKRGLGELSVLFFFNAPGGIWTGKENTGGIAGLISGSHFVLMGCRVWRGGQIISRHQDYFPPVKRVRMRVRASLTQWQLWLSTLTTFTNRVHTEAM